ncbi:MAG: hypothetical protein Q9209_005165 [Squamulea sp. 1 TL-2023]
MPAFNNAPESLAGTGDHPTDLIHSDTYPAIDPLKANLVGKRVLVVGPGTINETIAIAYAKAGASYIAIGAGSDVTLGTAAVKKAAEDADQKPPRILNIKLDVSSASSIDNAAALVQASFGGIDIIIIGFEAREEPKRTAESSLDKWWDTSWTNLRGPYLVARAFLPMILKGGDKTIVFLANFMIHGAHTHEASVYGTSQLAQLRLAEFIGMEYGDKGVLPFSVHLGNVPTGKWAGDVWEDHEHDMPQLMAMKKEIVNKDKLKVKLVV